MTVVTRYVHGKGVEVLNSEALCGSNCDTELQSEMAILFSATRGKVA